MSSMRITTYFPKYHISTVLMRQVRRTGTWYAWSLAERFVVQHDLVLHAHVCHRHDEWWSDGVLSIFQ